MQGMAWYLAVSRDIFGCYDQVKGDANGKYWVEARDVSTYPIMHRTPAPSQTYRSIIQHEMSISQSWKPWSSSTHGVETLHEGSAFPAYLSVVPEPENTLFGCMSG